ncbi:thiol reductant ABC exporter subunit CydD [Nocardia thailandica]
MARRPVDPRLWRYARSARRHLIVAVGLAMVVTATIVVTAVLLARVLAGVITDPGRRELGQWTAEFALLAVTIAVRALASWWQARLAHRAGAAVVTELEQAVLATAARLPPREAEARRTELAVIVGSGLSGLRAWFTGYLPALLLACLVPPVVMIVIGIADPASALIAVVTVPLIPVFMVLIGLLTQGRADETLTAATRLSDQLLDLFAGMPTLRALGRENPGGRSMAGRVRALGDQLRERTMRALRLAFLSSMVLELLATLSVAVIAVAIGMRLVYGEMSLYAGLVALILAPEVYLPLRQVGERFHAAQDGMAAGERAFAVLDAAPPAATAAGDVLGHGPSRIELREVSVAARDGFAPAGLSAVLEPGRVTVLTGPNGSGKSTALQAVLGLTAADRGAVTVDGRDVASLDPDAWWSRVAWLPQRPVLVPGTLRENVTLLGARIGPSAGAPSPAGGAGSRAGDVLDEVSRATGFGAVLAELPRGWETTVGRGGAGLSLGQRQRLALTRVLASRRPILLLDEPTAHLDADSEAEVLATLRRLAGEGATVVVVGHRPAVLAAADTVVEVGARTEAVAS